MKKIAGCLIVLGLLGLSGASGTTKISAEPAATLLLPYFEVDLNNPSGVNTTFSINNASSVDVLAHVTVWSDLSVPVLSFDVYLTGYDVQTVDLRGILLNGLLPQTAFSGLGCQLPPPPLSPSFVQHLQALLTGNASLMVGGVCAGQNLGDHVARGYITVDTVSHCTLLFPSDPGYFSAVATDNNVLWGDSFYFEPWLNTATGNTLVHIPAVNPAPPPGEYTFYGRYVGWTGADKRRPLATNFATRLTITMNPFSSTDLIVWRDSKVIQQPFNCAGGPHWYPLGQEGFAVFDEQENLDMVVPGMFPFPAEAQRVGVSNFLMAVTSGWVYLNLNTVVAGTPVPPNDPAAAQAWVAVTMDLEGRFEMGYDAIQLDNATNALHSVPP